VLTRLGIEGALRLGVEGFLDGLARGPFAGADSTGTLLCSASMTSDACALVSFFVESTPYFSDMRA